MAVIDFAERDTSSEKYTEYTFTNAESFYDTLLNFSDMIDRNFWQYHPAIHGQRRWIFRGHWDSNWELLPNAFRNGWYDRLLFKPFKTIRGSVYRIGQPQIVRRQNVNFQRITKKNKFQTQIRMECELLWQFMQISNSLGIECNYTPSFYKYYYERQKAEEWPEDDLLPLMSFAQHHGIPTRLLDFSYNPLFATFFAASYPFFEEYITKRKRLKKNKNLCVWAVDDRNPHGSSWREIPAPISRTSNIFAQEGVLIIDPLANKKFKATGKWQSLETMGEPERLIKLTLPQTEYKSLLRMLWKNDITPARIMPNLDKVTQTLEYIQWLWVNK